MPSFKKYTHPYSVEWGLRLCKDYKSGYSIVLSFGKTTITVRFN